MEATTATAKTGAAPSSAATGNWPGDGTSSTSDVRLLDYVKSNAPRIVSAISLGASAASRQTDLGEMLEYFAIAGELSTLCGLGGASGGNGKLGRSVAAGAGAGGSPPG